MYSATATATATSSASSSGSASATGNTLQEAIVNANIAALNATMNNMDNFIIYLNAYSGSFNYATDPYSDLPDTDPNTAVKKVYTDSGIAQLFDSPDLINLVGQYMYTENYANVKLNDQPDVAVINGQYSFFFPDGSIIYTIGANFNLSNDRGYPKPGTQLFYTIIGGAGKYLNAKGNILFEVTGLNNLSKITVTFQ